jgi:hypothetical protein
MSDLQLLPGLFIVRLENIVERLFKDLSLVKHHYISSKALPSSPQRL